MLLTDFRGIEIAQKIFGLAFFLLPILMSRLIIFSNIPWIILNSISALALIFLILVIIFEWKYQRGKTNRDIN